MLLSTGNWSVLALMAAFLLSILTACGTNDTISGTSERSEANEASEVTEMSSTSTPAQTDEAAEVGDVFFPQLQRPTDTPEMMIIGKLTLDSKGCLRVTGEGDDAAAPIWPPGFELSTEGGQIEILDRQGRPRAKVGERVLIGGWQVGVPSQLSVLDEGTRSELRQRCPADYWMSDGRMRILNREGSGRQPPS